LNALLVDVYNLLPRRFRRKYNNNNDDDHSSTSPNSPSPDMGGFGEEMEMQQTQLAEFSLDESSNEDLHPNTLAAEQESSNPNGDPLQVNKMLGSRKFWVAMLALFISYLIASLVKQLDVVFQYVGAISGTMICFIFPALFSLFIFDKESIQSKSVFIGLTKRSSAILLGAIGAFVMITSLFYSYFG
jgi:hypothetical protein